MFRFLAGACTVTILAMLALLLRQTLLPASASGSLELRLDCAPAAGIQASCSFPQGTSAVDVNIVLTNSQSSSVEVGAFNFEIATSQQVLTPVVSACDPLTAAFDCNPDFNQTGVTGAFTCSPPPPNPDINPSATIAVSRLACYLTGSGGLVLAPGASVTLGTVHYQPANGSSSLTLQNVSLSDTTGTELGSCSPVVQLAAACSTASVVIGPATATPTPTNTPIPNPSTSPYDFGVFLDCDTATAGIQGSCVHPSGTGMVDVQVVLVNNSGHDIQISGLDWGVFVDQGVLVPISVDPTEPWFCTTLLLDYDPSPFIAKTRAGCSLPNGSSSPSIGPSLVLGTISYAASAGTTSLTLHGVTSFDSSVVELISCNPEIEAPGFCAGASIQIGDGSATPIPSPTATPTATATSCVQGSVGCATATPTPTFTMTPMPTATNPPTGGLPFGLFLDCDPSAAGIQAQCNRPPWIHQASVDVVLVNNSGVSTKLVAFNYTVRTNQDVAIPKNLPGPSQSNCTAPKLNCNPDFNESIGEPGWFCDPLRSDYDSSPNIAMTDASCINISSPPTIISGTSLVLGTIYYTVNNGTFLAELRDVNVFDDSITEMISCNPWLTVEGYCQNATMSFGVDNCPSVVNLDQANTNSEPIALPKPAPAWDDVTNPAADYEGDACDSDIDGDGVSNTDEATLSLDAYDWDTDNDRVSDGAERACGSNPSLASSVPSGADGDNDGLPDACESAFGTNPADSDSDDDAVKDGVEVRYWRTNPLARDTDGDECSDAKEIATVNGDRAVNSGDLLILVLNFGALPPGLWPYDSNGDARINSGDQLFAANTFGPCAP